MTELECTIVGKRKLDDGFTQFDVSKNEEGKKCKIFQADFFERHTMGNCRNKYIEEFSNRNENQIIQNFTSRKMFKNLKTVKDSRDAIRTFCALRGVEIAGTLSHKCAVLCKHEDRELYVKVFPVKNVQTFVTEIGAVMEIAAMACCSIIISAKRLLPAVAEFYHFEEKLPYAVYECENDEKVAVMAIEKYGPTLRKWIQKSTLNDLFWKQLEGIILQITISLYQLQSHLDFVHGDLHTENVLLMDARGYGARNVIFNVDDEEMVFFFEEKDAVPFVKMIDLEYATLSTNVPGSKFKFVNACGYHTTHFNAETNSFDLFRFAAAVYGDLKFFGKPASKAPGRLQMLFKQIFRVSTLDTPKLWFETCDEHIFFPHLSGFHTPRSIFKNNMGFFGPFKGYGLNETKSAGPSSIFWECPDDLVTAFDVMYNKREVKSFVEEDKVKSLWKCIPWKKCKPYVESEECRFVHKYFNYAVHKTMLELKRDPKNEHERTDVPGGIVNMSQVKQRAYERYLRKEIIYFQKVLLYTFLWFEEGKEGTFPDVLAAVHAHVHRLLLKKTEFSHDDKKTWELMRSPDMFAVVNSRVAAPLEACKEIKFSEKPQLFEQYATMLRLSCDRWMYSCEKLDTIIGYLTAAE